MLMLTFISSTTSKVFYFLLFISRWDVKWFLLTISLHELSRSEARLLSVFSMSTRFFLAVCREHYHANFIHSSDFKKCSGMWPSAFFSYSFRFIWHDPHNLKHTLLAPNATAMCVELTVYLFQWYFNVLWYQSSQALMFIQPSPVT